MRRTDLGSSINRNLKKKKQNQQRIRINKESTKNQQRINKESIKARFK